MKENDENMEFLTQPLLTEEGFVNEACIDELKSVIKNSSKPYEKWKNDDEWNEKVGIFRQHITSYLAKWAIRQSPYVCPDGLCEVVCYLDVCLKKEVEWDHNDYADLSLNKINELLYSILYEQGFSIFDSWNKPKKGGVEIVFSSRYSSGPDPDYDFIDLDALLRNVCIDIRDERRIHKKFDEEFEKKYGKIEE